MARRRYRKRTKKPQKSLAQKVAKLQKTLKLQKPETKWYEVYSTADSCTASGTSGTGGIISLTAGMTQAAGDFGVRIGDSITMKGLRLRFIVNNQSSEYCQVYRVIVFQFLRDPDGATSTASLLNLLLHSTHVGTANAPLAQYDHDNRSSFKVHYDRLFNMNAGNYNTTLADSMGTTRYHVLNIRFPPRYREVKFYNAGSTNTKNELFFTILTNSGTSIGFNYVGTVYYIDP